MSATADARRYVMFHIVAKPPFSPRAQALKAMVPSRLTDSYDIANLFVCSL